MYSKFEMASMDSFELELAINQNKFEIALETAYNQFVLENELMLFTEAEGSGGGLGALLKSFANAIKNFWNNLTNTVKKAFTSVPDPNKQINCTDIKGARQVTTNANTSALELIKGIANGSKSEKDVDAWKNGIEKAWNALKPVTVAAGGLMAFFGVKEKLIDPIDREVDEILDTIAADKFKDAANKLSRTSGQENYDAIKKQQISEIMQHVQKSNNKFYDLLKDIKAQAYLGKKLDKEAEALTNPIAAKDLVKDELEKAKQAKREARGERVRGIVRNVSGKVIDKAKDQRKKAEADLDNVRSQAYDDHEKSKEADGGKVKNAIDNAIFGTKKKENKEKLFAKARGNIHNGEETKKEKRSLADKAKGNI